MVTLMAILVFLFVMYSVGKEVLGRTEKIVNRKHNYHTGISDGSWGGDASGSYGGSGSDCGDGGGSDGGGGGDC